MTETPRLLGGNQTRRSVLRKGAAATGALALGGIGGTGAVGARDWTAQAAVNAFRFYPGASFDVVAGLETETTVELLQVDDEPVPELSQPDEWNAHAIRYGIGEEAGITTLLFTRDRRMNDDDIGTLGVDASMLNADLNLLRVPLESGGRTEESNDGSDRDGGA